MDRDRLDAAIQQIRAYTRAHPDLQKGHHFVFDYPLDKSAGKPEVLVMGINPGEVESQWSVPGPTESTWNYDFHHKVHRSRSSRNWHNNALFFSDGRPVVFTDLFFWSASDQKQFEQRYGPLWRSPHLSFCVSNIKILLDEYQPKMVIFPGLGQAERAAKVFGLGYVRAFSRGGTRLVEHYRDRDRPWFFTRHWSGAFGFSNDQKISIRQYIRGEIRGSWPERNSRARNGSPDFLADPSS